MSSKLNLKEKLLNLQEKLVKARDYISSIHNNEKENQE